MSKLKKSTQAVQIEENIIPTVAFNVWFAMREKRIPARHLREIIWADFKGQGLSNNETIAAFDAALVRYGVKF